MEIFEKAGGSPMSLDELMKTADIVIGVTGVAGLLKAAMIRKGRSFWRSQSAARDSRRGRARAGAAFAADDAA